MDRLFEAWRGKDLEGILYECRELLEDTNFPTVARWRESGGKVVGHFQVYFPEEIAHAAGMLPFKVRGAPIEAMQADSRFGSYLCSILKTSLELALSGRVQLDMFVTHPICDAARNLAAVWGRNFSYPCQILYLPQNANSPAAVTYLRNEYARLQRSLEGIAGRLVSDDDLHASLDVYNWNRTLLRQLYDIKRETPWLVSADEAYVLVAIGGLIRITAARAHLKSQGICVGFFIQLGYLDEQLSDILATRELLETALCQIVARPNKKQDKMRLVFEGGFCEQPPLDLIRAIARSCYVVDDDLLIGMRWILDDVELEGDPLFNLAHAYLEKSSYSPVQHDLRKPKEQMLIDRITNARAEAAIITAAKMCEPGLEEQVAYLHALDRAGIPYFISEFEEKMTTFDHMEIQLQTFVENLLFS